MFCFTGDKMNWTPILLIVCFAASDVMSTKCWNVSQVMDFPQHNVHAPRRYWQRQAEPILRGALFQMEDFPECMNELDGHYCLTKVQFQPTDNSTEFWRTIQKHNRIRTNYRRDVLNIGLCVPKHCTDADVIEDLIEFLTPAANKLRIQFNVTITGGQCATNEKKPLIALDYITILVLLVIVILVLSGTIYDTVRRFGIYKKASCMKGREFLMCFSLLSNWERLGKLSDSEDSVTFRCIQGIRAISMYLVILGHVGYYFIIVPLRNPEVLEEAYQDILKATLFNGQATMGTFLCISGMMLSYFFLKEYEARKSISIGGILIAIVYRYIRLTPAMVVMILLQATILDRVRTGPTWLHIMGQQVENCRLYGWTNLLYLQNYVNHETVCLPHTWYLAADFQCYIVSLLLLYLVCKYPKHSKKIFTVALVFWIIVPFVQTYLQRLDPVVLSSPEGVKVQALDRTFNRRYVTMHANAGAFTVGVIFGYLCYHVKRKGFKRTQKMFILLWVNNLFVPWIILILPFMFYQPSYTYDVVGASIFAGVSKVIFAAGIGTLITSFALGYGGIGNTLTSWKPLQIFGRISYCVYLIHPSLLYTEAGATIEPLYISDYIISQVWFKTIVTTSICALILVLCVELPTSSLMRLLRNQERDRLNDKSPKSYIDTLQNEIAEKTIIDDLQAKDGKDKATRAENELHKMSTVDDSTTGTQQEDVV